MFKFELSYCCLFRELQHAEMQNAIAQLAVMDNQLKTLVQNGVLMRVSAESVQSKIVQMMNCLMRQQVMIEVMWREIESGAFMTSSSTVADASVAKNQKHLTPVCLPIPVFRKLLDEHAIDSYLLESHGLFVLDFDLLKEKVLIGEFNEQKSQWFSGKHCIEAWVVYGLFCKEKPSSNDISLRMSFVSSALQAVIKKEMETQTLPAMSPRARLEDFFTAWLEFVEARERQRRDNSSLVCQIVLLTISLEKKMDYLTSKKQKR